MKMKLRNALSLLLCLAMVLCLIPAAFAEGAESLTIPDGVTVIEAEAFSGCESITKLTIPAGISSIGQGAFAGLSALEEISYEGSPAMWRRIEIGADNEPLYQAILRFADGRCCVPVSERVFPDEAFLSCVESFDTNEDDVLSETELAAVKTLDVSSRGIASLKGAEYFTGLKALYCDGNQLTALELSAFPELVVLSADGNRLTDINLGANPRLYRVHLGANRLKRLDISRNTELAYLDVKGNQLTELDLSAAPVLAELVDSGKLTRKTDNGITYDEYTSIRHLTEESSTALYETLAVGKDVTLKIETYIDTPSDFRIGIVTGSLAQSEDEYRGAEDLQARYGSDMVRLETYPENFMENREGVVELIASMADDPRMKAVIVSQAIPGTAEAFSRIKSIRPDILCIAGESHEDLTEIGSNADLVLNSDFIARGYLIVRTAHELGCDTFVHISFQRHMNYETMSRRVAIMKAACKEFGMEFVQETAPDPTTDVGVAGAQAYMLEKTPQWVEQYGGHAAFFCTNDAHVEPLINKLLSCGGYFIEADMPSPLLGYPGALGVDLSDLGGNFPAILNRIEQAVTAQGGAGRFGTWTCPYGYALTAGLGQHAINAVTDPENYDLLDSAKLYAALTAFSSGTTWNGSRWNAADTGMIWPNVFLIYQDTYIMGNPGHYMGSTSVAIPEKYFTIK